MNEIFNKAINAHKNNDLQEAEKNYRLVLAENPKHSDANHNLGVLAQSVGNIHASLPFFKSALVENSNIEQYWISFIEGLIISFRLKDALKVANEAIEIKKLNKIKFENFKNKINQIETSRIEINNLLNFPRSKIDNGFYEEAIAYLENFLSINKNDPQALSLMSDALIKVKKYNLANISLIKAQKINPDLSYVRRSYVRTLISKGILKEAYSIQMSIIESSAQDKENWLLLGNIYLSLGNIKQAEINFNLAIALDEYYIAAQINIGVVLQNLNRQTDALAQYKKVVTLSPDYYLAYNNIGMILLTLGKIEESQIFFKKSITLRPSNHDIYSNYILSSNYLSETSYIDNLNKSADYYENISKEKVTKFKLHQSYSNQRKIKIGFVSGDLRDHPVGYFIEELLTRINKDKFELIAYPTNIKETDLTLRIKKHFSRWIPIIGISDKEAAMIIYKDQIDILIDLAGHTAHNRLPVFLYKPATLQVTWLGYFATTGMPEIDYIIGDPYVTPLSEQSHFVEKICQLPDTYICFSPPKINLQISELPAISNGYITFGCFNNLTKINDNVILLWSKLLDILPTSKLHLKCNQFSNKINSKELVSKFNNYGIHQNRLIIEGWTSRLDYFKSYNSIDIALDPFPFPGGTTSVEGLWMGVPVVTLRGDRFISHNGESIANNSGQQEWIANDEDDYIRIASKFASDLNRLRKIRIGMRDQITKAPLFDAERFTHNFETKMIELLKNS